MIKKIYETPTCLIAQWEEDIITNYHVNKILDLREELMVLIADITKR